MTNFRQTIINSITMLGVSFLMVLSLNAQNVLVTENFDEGAIPNDWIILDENQDNYSWRIYNSPTYAHSQPFMAGSPGFMTEIPNDDYLILPKLGIDATNHTVSFWGRSANYDYEDIEVRLSTGGATASDFTILLEAINDMPQTYTKYEYDLSAYIGQEVYFAIRYVSPADLNIPCIDDVTYPKLSSSVDMAVAELYNEIDLLPNYPNQMFVPVMNAGSQTCSNFTINIYQQEGANSNLFSTYDINQSIAPGNTENIEFVIEFPNVGNYDLFAEVVAEGDAVAENNTSNITSFTVSDTAHVSLGFPYQTDTGDVPSSFFHKNSLTQTLYQSEHINMYPGMTLSELIYVLGNGLNNSGTQDITIYIGETSRQTLNDGQGMIPASQLTEIFSGSISIPTGNHDISIPIDPYVYTGQNLVIMTQKVDNGCVPYAGWRKKDIGIDGSTLAYLNHNIAADPFNPPAMVNLEVMSSIPSVHFSFINTGVETGSLSGTVKDVSNNPIAGALVHINENNMNTTSDANGNYTFATITTGTYSLTASKDGYSPASASDVTITADNNTVQDFVLEEAVTGVHVNGHVYYTNTQTAIENVSVQMTSDDNTYTAQTNSTGYYSFDDVAINSTYELVYSKTGLEDANKSITVAAEDVEVENVYMTDVMVTPSNLSASYTANGDVQFSWQHAKSFVEFEVFLDNNSVGTTSSPQHIFSNLVYNREYQFGVRANYTSGSTPIVTMNFTSHWESVAENSNNSLNLYPNPSDGKISIHMIQDETISIYDISGKLVFTEVLTTGHNTLDISFLKAGIYQLTSSQTKKNIKLIIK